MAGARARGAPPKTCWHEHRRELRPIPHAERLRTGRRSDRLAGHLALAGASLGALAGLLELTVRPSVRDWVGNKQDTTRLGLTTLVLSAVAASRPRLETAADDAGGRRVAIVLALLVPALVCFTTVGRLWYLPGALLLGAGALVLARTRRRDFAAALDGSTGAWGSSFCAAPFHFPRRYRAGARRRARHSGGARSGPPRARAPLAARAYAFLFSGALPFAAATWWSVITPVLAVLAVVIGVRRHPPRRPTKAPETTAVTEVAAWRSPAAERRSPQAWGDPVSRLGSHADFLRPALGG